MCLVVKFEIAERDGFMTRKVGVAVAVVVVWELMGGGAVVTVWGMIRSY